MSLQRRHQRWAAPGGGSWHCWRPLGCCGCRGRASPEVSAGRGCGGEQSRAVPAQGLVCSPRRLPGQPGGAWAECPCPHWAQPVRGPGWGPAVLPDGLPHLFYPCSLPPSPRFAAALPHFPGALSPPRRRGPLRPLPLWGRCGQDWGPAAPGPREGGGGPGAPAEPLSVCLSRRGMRGHSRARPQPWGPSLGGEGEEPQPRGMPRSVGNINHTELCYKEREEP